MIYISWHLRWDYSDRWGITVLHLSQEELIWDKTHLCHRRNWKEMLSTWLQVDPLLKHFYLYLYVYIAVSTVTVVAHATARLQFEFVNSNVLYMMNYQYPNSNHTKPVRKPQRCRCYTSGKRKKGSSWIWMLKTAWGSPKTLQAPAS